MTTALYAFYGGHNSSPGSPPLQAGGASLSSAFSRVYRACRKTPLSVAEASWPPCVLSTVAGLSVLPALMPCLLTCRPVPGPASVCSDCRRGETGDLPSPASATDVLWAC